MQDSKTVIIGIDGVPFNLIKELSAKNIMQNFKDIKKNGIFKKMESSKPEISSVSWSSIITGKNPGEHGIYGFTDIIPYTYSLRYPNRINLKSPPFWEQTNESKNIIINVPSTYPVHKLNGFIVSGFVSLDLEKAVYPKEKIEILKKIDYQIDVDSNKAHKSIPLFLKNLRYTLEKRIELYRHLWRTNEWDTFMLVFTGSDRLEHFLIDAYYDSDHDYHENFLDYFRRIDDVIGEINSNLSENDNLLLLSDHGMEKIKTNVNLNTFLEQNSILEIGENISKRYNNIKEGTKAFALDPSRIYINKKDKYPKGNIKPEEEQNVKDELFDLFSSLTFNGEKVIKKIYEKEEIYHGSEIDYAPDLVLLPKSGYSLRGNIGKKDIFEKDDIIKGMHSQPDAFLFIKNIENKEFVPEKPNVEYITKIMENITKKQGEVQYEYA